MNRFLLALSILLLAACHQKEISAKKYFNIDSLINNQIAYLTTHQASIEKSASVEDASDEAIFTPDKLGWEKELADFRHLELINKPIYLGAYEVKDRVKDPNSNLLILQLDAKSNLPIKQFKIYYKENPYAIKKLEASLSEQNALYFTSRKFTLELDDIDGKDILRKYQEQGIQKMILRDSVKFSITSIISY